MSNNIHLLFLRSLCSLLLWLVIISCSSGTEYYQYGGHQYYQPNSYGQGNNDYYNHSESSNEDDSFYCQQKRREYEVALEQYNRALKRYNDAEAMGFINDTNWETRQYSKPGFNKGMAFLGMMSGRMSVNDAIREVDVARERLNAATLQLCR